MGVHLPQYPVTQPPEWAAKYVGIPYEMGGRGPAVVDCWGCVWIVASEEFGIPVPSYEGIVWTVEQRESLKAAGTSIMSLAETQFDEIAPGEEQPGDVIVLMLGRYPLHCGIVIEQGWMLHAAEDADVACERFDNMVWRFRVAGFYRWRA